MKLDIAGTVIAVSLWLLVMIGSTGYYIWHWLETPVNITAEEQVFAISKGENLSRVSRQLSSKKIIRWPQVWVFYARLVNLTDIKAGGIPFF